ncbi:MAG: hypothetical protein EAZ97_06535 [Bacteroidetes bacterium]|nr:MAG: hypothetical protein EAZ97_06535 [Bacteroidota bacterium]
MNIFSRKNDKPKVNQELKDFEVKINALGELTSNYNIDQINEFLNKNVTDKKLKDRNGYKNE